MLLFFLAIFAVELSHILNENKTTHFHQSYLDTKLETIIDFFFPLLLFPVNPPSSPSGSTSKIYPKSDGFSPTSQLPLLFQPGLL